MFKFVLTLISLSMLTGCATILNDEYQNINVSSSNNTEIKGNIDGKQFTGPGIISVRRSKADKILIVDTPACQKQTLMRSDVDMKFFINILTGGTFGSTTDYSTEEMWKYQDTVIVQCK